MIEVNQTELTTWLHCRRRWFHDFMLRPDREDPVSGPLALGSAVHQSLADYYGYERDPRHIIEDLSEDYDVAMLENPEQAANIADDRDVAVPVTEGYFDWLASEGADSGTDTLSAEHKIELEIAEGITLHGTIDRVYRRHTGLIVIQDHKTVAQFDNADALQIDFQGLTYSLLYKMCHPDEQFVFEYNMLKKNKRTARAKPPFYKRVEVRYSDEQLRSHWRHVVAVATEIKKAREELRHTSTDTHHTVCPPSPGRECTWRCDLGISGCALLDDTGGTEFLVSLTTSN